ncbi:hypothetical protein EON63_05965 [archaeon]|nr:MAG: hypothetical protein EON63_05965 [archaeon]
MVDVEGYSALILAVEKGGEEGMDMTQALLEAGAVSVCSCLLRASLLRTAIVHSVRLTTACIIMLYIHIHIRYASCHHNYPVPSIIPGSQHPNATQEDSIKDFLYRAKHVPSKPAHGPQCAQTQERVQSA